MSDNLTQPLEALDDLRTLRAQRNEKLLGDRPPVQKEEARAAYDQSVSKDQHSIDERRQRVLNWAENASPDQIDALQKKIQEADKAKAESLPDSQHEQVAFQTVQQWRQQRQGEDQRPPMLTREQQKEDGPGRLGYAEYARTSQKEAAFMKDYENNFDWDKHEKQRQRNVFSQ